MWHVHCNRKKMNISWPMHMMHFLSFHFITRVKFIALVKGDVHLRHVHFSFVHEIMRGISEILKKLSSIPE